MSKYAEPPFKTSIRWVPTLLLCLLLSGCNLLPGGPVETIQEPPLIPDPATDLQSAKSDPKPLISAYADLIDFNDITLYHPQLHDAVSTAIRLGILKPASIDEKFEPNTPIQYGEFRQWSILYQGAAKGIEMIQVSPPASETPAKPDILQNTTVTPNKPPPATPPKPNPSPSPMSPAALMILPSELQWGEHRLLETRVLTREELCALYTFLSQQDTTARTLQPSEVESTTPKGSVNADEALSQFKDYFSIDNWAKRYVAIAYRDGILQKVWNLTPNQLTIDSGFNPKKEISRGDAIILLHTLFSQEAVKRESTKPTKPQPDTNPGTVDPLNGIAPANPTLPEKIPFPTPTSEKPKPISHLQTIQETGPQGSKSAIRVSGPD